MLPGISKKHKAMSVGDYKDDSLPDILGSTST